MYTTVWLVTCALAVFRVAEMFVIDDGPGEIFVNLRGWFNAAPANQPIRRAVADALTCVHCVGVWLAFPLAFTFPLSGVPEFLITWFAIAGLQSVTANKLGRSQ